MARLVWSLVLLAACTADDPDGNGDTDAPPGDTDDTDPADTDVADPDYGTLSLTVEGRTLSLDLEAPVGLGEGVIYTLEWRAEHSGNLAEVDGSMIDTSALRETEYPLGVVDAANRRTDIGVGYFDMGQQFRYLTPEGPGEGTLTIQRLDRAQGRISFTWSGTFEKFDAAGVSLGAAAVQGSVTDGALEVL